MKKKRILFLILTLFMTYLQASAFEYVENIKVGDYLSLRPNITTYGRSYSWSYEGGDKNCVSVSGMYSGSTGASVRGVKAGWVIIQCDGYSKDGKTYYWDIWEINVEDDKPESISISPSSLDIDVNATASVSASVNPSGAQYSTIYWSSNNSNIASVSTSGKSATVRGVSVGTTTLSATTDNGGKGSCSVKVWGISPTAISISGESGVYIGYTKQMTVSFTPSTHHSAITWTSDKPSVATISQKGVVTGVSSGTAVIKATTDNGLSASKTITVTEPPFTLESTLPNNGTTDVTVFQQPSATYSLALYSGAQASDIKLYAGSESDKVDGQVSISGKTVTFVPTRALKPFTKYTFLIPANGVKNQWGTGYNKDVSFSFTTGDVSPMTLTASMAAGYVEAGDQLVLKASESDAEIRYTTDGSEPSEKSTLYTSPIVINKEVTIWARAYKNGYATPEYKGTYKISHVHVTDKYPANEQLYIYKDVNPYIAYDVNVKEGPQFSSLSIKREDGKVVNGKFLLHLKRLAFVPDNDLELGHTYTIIIPEGAVVANDGEPNKAIQWSFTSGEFIRSISAGYRHATAVKTDNTLLYWGQKIKTYDGGDTFDADNWSSPKQIDTNVSVASSGFTHNLYAKTNGQVWGWGIQFCGEVGNSSNALVVDPVLITGVEASQVVAGGQTSAILKDGTLKMAGRNDFGQVGDITLMAYSDFQPFVSLSNVKQIAPGWQSTMVLQDNGALYGWGYNGNGLIEEDTHTDSYAPKQIMTGVESCAISKWSNANAAVIKTDGSLWTWGLNEAGQIGDGTGKQAVNPVQIMDGIKSISIGNRFMAAIGTNGDLWTWGDNTFGQLGNGNTSSVNQPQKVMDEVESIELGPNYAIALKEDGSVWTWGANEFSQLGNGSTDAYKTTPTKILEGRERKQFENVEVVDAAITLAVDDQAVVCAKPIPLQADYKEWTWSTSDASVAIVDERGVVTGIKEGTAVITLTSDNGKTAKSTITVGTANSIDLIEANKLSEIFDVYDLQGRKIRSQVRTIDSLPKGVYIINGKKILKNY